MADSLICGKATGVMTESTTLADLDVAPGDTGYEAPHPAETRTSPQAAARTPGDFFDPKDGLLAATLTRVVEDIGPIATSDGAVLHHYTDGVWRGDGERVIRERVAGLLDEQYRMMHASTVVDILRNREPRLNSADLDTRYLNLPNGLLDWRTGDLLKHSPEVRSTTRIPVEWESGAECPEISKWLREVFPEDCLGFVEEVIGYTLYNENPLHKAIMLFGRGRNGKGTFLRLLTTLIGKENISSVSPQALDENRFMGAELYGKLANFAGDVDPRTFKATEMFKKVTGEDWITAERKHGQPFQFISRAVMLAAFNRLPRTADTTEGFFSRWIIVPFTGYFPSGVADTGLMERLTKPDELAGLLVLAVAGLRRLMQRGHFELPGAVEQATTAFRRAADPVRAFLHESTKGEYNGWMPRTELFDAYKRWADDNGYKPMGAATFYERASEAGEDVFGYPLGQKGRHGVRGFAGLAWRTASDTAVREPDEQSSSGHIPWPEVAEVAEVAGSPTSARAYVGGKVDHPATSATPATRAAAPAALNTCTACGEQLDQALIDAGFTTHGEDASAA